MSTYNIKFTDDAVDPIKVEEYLIDDSLDTIFPGRIRLEWGEEINNNFLRLLENFACPEDNSGGNEHSPDLAAAHGDLLSNPVEGQIWFNTTRKTLYSYNGTEWIPYSNSGVELGANWGQVWNGEQLPRPVSPSGYEFHYDECIWSVSPFHYQERFSYVNCTSDALNSTVTMQYRLHSTADIIDGIANYLIIGIRGNTNLGDSVNIPNPF